MGIGAYQCIGVGEPCAVLLRGKDAASEILKVYLMHDTGTGWHDFKVFERLLAPTQKFVTFQVSLDFDGGVLREGGLSTEVINHD